MSPKDTRLLPAFGKQAKPARRLAIPFDDAAISFEHPASFLNFVDYRNIQIRAPGKSQYFFLRIRLCVVTAFTLQSQTILIEVISQKNISSIPHDSMPPSVQLLCLESQRLSLLAKSDCAHLRTIQEPHSRLCLFRGYRPSIA